MPEKLRVPKIADSKICLVHRNKEAKKNGIKEKFGVQKILVPKKILGSKDFGSKIIWVQTKIGYKKLLDLNFFCFEILLSQKKFWAQKNVGSKKFDFKKFLVQKKLWVQANFWSR